MPPTATEHEVDKPIEAEAAGYPGYRDTTERTHGRGFRDDTDHFARSHIDRVQPGLIEPDG